MGVNIILYESKEDPNNPGKYAVRSDVFDSDRHTGDREFVRAWSTFDAEFWHSGDYGDMDVYIRFNNHDEVASWIKSNIPEINQGRLLDLVELMRTSPAYWLYCSN